MPRYGYACEKCKKDFEVTLTVAERTKAKLKCPSCRSTKVTPRLMVFTAKTTRKS